MSILFYLFLENLAVFLSLLHLEISIYDYSYIISRLLNRKQHMIWMTIELTPPMIIMTTLNTMEEERRSRFHLEQRGTQSPLSSQYIELVTTILCTIRI